jgi:hypothetical protein
VDFDFGVQRNRRFTVRAVINDDILSIRYDLVLFCHDRTRKDLRLNVFIRFKSNFSGLHQFAPIQASMRFVGRGFTLMNTDLCLKMSIEFGIIAGTL